MKYLTNISIIALSVFLITIAYLFAAEKKTLRTSYLYNKELTDSLNKYKANSNYLKNLWYGLRDNHNLKVEKESSIFKLERSKKIKINLLDLIKNKKLLIIRYTQIGCNACVDSTFKLLNRYENLKKYKIITVVDFDNTDYYLKWRKISEFDGDVFWLKKGDILYPVEQGNNSYIFTLGNDLNAQSLFIPNSSHVDLLKEYLQSL